jgi:hypothetical protein
MQPRDDLRDKVVVGGRLTLKDRATGHMHMGRVPLEMQERAIEAG